jgi:putative ABC transport system ATP-binding protein
MSPSEPLILARGLSHTYREDARAAASRQVLSELEVAIDPGEIVLLTGPSGSGRTTFLTLVGALRSVQQGSLRVFGQELAGASAAGRVAVRRRIGYIFQAHNLIAALSARDNVLLPLELDASLDGRTRRQRAEAMLEAVGLGDYLDTPPSGLSGGQRQRVAIARALAASPSLVLADEPTASLDRATGRAVVELLEKIAREQSVSVLLVTHDHRILDIADRVLHLEDGRLSSYTAAVAANTEHLLASLGRTYSSGQLLSQLEALPPDRFTPFLAELTEEARQFLDIVQLAENETITSMLRQVLDGLTRRIGLLLGAERATLFLLDRERGELWSLYAGVGDGNRRLRLAVALGRGIAGKVAASGIARMVPEAYADPDFDASYDQRSGFVTRNLLCVPIVGREGGVIAVAQLLNKTGNQTFSSEDERAFRELAGSLGPILESWLELAARQSGPGKSVPGTAAAHGAAPGS